MFREQFSESRLVMRPRSYVSGHTVDAPLDIGCYYLTLYLKERAGNLKAM